jgi:hypothetical protein
MLHLWLSSLELLLGVRLCWRVEVLLHTAWTAVRGWISFVVLSAAELGRVIDIHTESFGLVLLSHVLLITRLVNFLRVHVQDDSQEHVAVEVFLVHEVVDAEPWASVHHTRCPEEDEEVNELGKAGSFSEDLRRHYLQMVVEEHLKTVREAKSYE